MYEHFGRIYHDISNRTTRFVLPIAMYDILLAMMSELQEIIKLSSFTVVDGQFVYVKVATVPNISNHLMVAQDNDEITVVTREENLRELNIIERNKDEYALIALNVSVPFYSVGFLATVSSAIANAGMDILIISTYSKDYILIRADELYAAKEILLSLGFKQK